MGYQAGIWQVSGVYPVVVSDGQVVVLGRYEGRHQVGIRSGYQADIRSVSGRGQAGVSSGGIRQGQVGVRLGSGRGIR